MKEAPLILFTVLSQAAVGLVLFSTLILWALSAERQATMASALRNAGRIALPLTLVALAASFFHLGQPVGGLRAFSNMGSSWLSREILFMALFSAGVAALFFLWQWQPQSGLIRPVSALTALLGLVTVYATGMVYQLPTRPEWNHWSNLVSGFVTALLLGAMIMGLLSLLTPDAAPEARRLLGYTALVAAGLLLIGLAFYAPYLSGVSAATAGALFGSPWFWVRLLAGIGLPVVAAAQLLRGTQPSVALLSLALVAAVGGEVIGRSLFYTTVLEKLPLF